MTTMIFFDSFLDDLAEGVFALGSDTLKIALTNTAPVVATDHQFSDISEIAAGNGYTAGGQALDNVASSQTAGVYTLAADDEVFTAAGGTMATFRYVVLYDDDAANDELIGYWDKGAAVSLADGVPFTVGFTGGIVFSLTTST